MAGHRLVALADIGRFTARDGLVYAFTGDGHHVIDESLDELERRLAGAFIRISRGDLVAIDRIDRTRTNGDGSATILLKDATECRVARRRTADLRKTLAW